MDIIKIYSPSSRAYASRLDGIDADGRYLRKPMRRIRDAYSWRIEIEAQEGECYTIDCGKYKGCYQIVAGRLVKCPYPDKYDFAQKLREKMDAS